MLGPAFKPAAKEVLYPRDSMQLLTFSVTPKPSNALAAEPKGGVFEPALALVLLKNERLVETMLAKWVFQSSM